MSNKTTIIADPGSPIIRFERVFDAPRDKVFEVFTNKDMLAKWWSPSKTARIDELDVREGGLWKFTDVSPDGSEIAFHGYFHEITPPERFVQTSEFDNLVDIIGERGHTVLARYEFKELPDGQTQYIGTEIYMSADDRDMAIQSGMESGVVQSFNNIDAIFEETQNA